VSEQVSPGDSKPALEYLAGLVAVYNNANGKRVCEASISLLAPKHAFFKKEDAMFKRVLAEIHMVQDNPWDSYKLM